MKIKIQGFLGTNHSWSVVQQNIARSMKNMGHDVHLFSTNGYEHFPSDLRGLVRPQLDSNYDCQISYTAMVNFPTYLANGNKNRFGIWCYEWAGENILPSGFAKHYKSCDYLCPPSEFSKRVFLESKIPSDNIKVIPHGIDKNQYSQTSVIDLKTKKSFKILANIAQNHLRKNIPGLLEAYGQAFSKKDDVVLILKAKVKPAKQAFEISLQDCLNNFYKKYPNHAEVKILSEFIPDISALYRSVDATFTLTHAEGFYFPGLESIASGKLAIAPNWGGQIDFLNHNNSLLISGKEVRANPRSMYWEAKKNAIWFEPDIKDAVNKLNYAYHNYQDLNKKIENDRENILNIYSWENISKQIIELCK